MRPISATVSPGCKVMSRPGSQGPSRSSCPPRRAQRRLAGPRAAGRPAAPSRSSPPHRCQRAWAPRSAPWARAPEREVSVSPVSTAIAQAAAPAVPPPAMKYRLANPRAGRLAPATSRCSNSGRWRSVGRSRTALDRCSASVVSHLVQAAQRTDQSPATRSGADGLVQHRRRVTPRRGAERDLAARHRSPAWRQAISGASMLGEVLPRSAATPAVTRRLSAGCSGAGSSSRVGSQSWKRSARDGYSWAGSPILRRLDRRRGYLLDGGTGPQAARCRTAVASPWQAQLSGRR